MAEPALRGVQVVAFEQAAAGPFATHLLADMGADVIKIERPGTGDIARGWDRAVAPGISSAYAWLNRRKRSITLDPRSESGRAILKRLVERADVFLSNAGPGVTERLGIGYRHSPRAQSASHLLRAIGVRRRWSISRREGVRPSHSGRIGDSCDQRLS